MKTKALISFAVTVKLICVYVFAYANIRFSRVAAQMSITNQIYLLMLIKISLIKPITLYCFTFYSKTTNLTLAFILLLMFTNNNLFLFEP